MLTHGSRIVGICILHSCDNPPCCNPAHLFKGTRAVNNADKIAKGRARHWSPPGEQSVHAKVTEAQVRDIRRRHAQGDTTQTCLAAEFGVSPSNIWQIVTRRSWKHVR